MYKNHYQKNSYENLYYSQLENISNLENENKKLKELLDLIEKWYCRKYYEKDKLKCKCWTCRFYDYCVNLKEGD